jgi:hypothetical protein
MRARHQLRETPLPCCAATPGGRQIVLLRSPSAKKITAPPARSVLAESGSTDCMWISLGRAQPVGGWLAVGARRSGAHSRCDEHRTDVLVDQEAGHSTPQSRVSGPGSTWTRADVTKSSVDDAGAPAPPLAQPDSVPCVCDPFLRARRKPIATRCAGTIAGESQTVAQPAPESADVRLASVGVDCRIS